MGTNRLWVLAVEGLVGSQGEESPHFNCMAFLKRLRMRVEEGEQKDQAYHLTLDGRDGWCCCEVSSPAGTAYGWQSVG